MKAFGSSPSEARPPIRPGLAWRCRAGRGVSGSAPSIPRAVARGHRLDQLRAGAARLRPGAAPAAPSRATRCSSRSAAASRAVLSGVAPGLEPTRADALALALVGRTGGVLAIVGTWALVREAAAQCRRAASQDALWAAALLSVAPLFWFTGLRPMSDSLGLGITVCAQALLLAGFRRPVWPLIAGVALAGLGAGIRVQSAALTLPLLAAGVLTQGRGWWRARGRFRRGPACGRGPWAVLMLAAAGGIDGVRGGAGLSGRRGLRVGGHVVAEPHAAPARPVTRTSRSRCRGPRHCWPVRSCCAPAPASQ